MYKVNYFLFSDRSLIFNKSRALFHLNCFNLVSVITEKSRERKSSNLLQLLQCKATRPATILVEKSSEILVVSDGMIEDDEKPGDAKDANLLEDD